MKEELHVHRSAAARPHCVHWVALMSRQNQGESNISTSCRYTQHAAILLIKWKAFLPCCLLLPLRQKPADGIACECERKLEYE